MTTPGRPERQTPETAEHAFVPLTDVPTVQLKQLKQQHLVWLLGSCCLTLVAWLFPDSNLLLSLVRMLLAIVGLGGGYVRLMQINGINNELATRSTP
jgi:hypothetical protein